MKHVLQLIAAISVLSLISIASSAQTTVTFNNGGSTIIPCGDANTFLDGYGGAYGDNIDQTFTVCVTPGTGLAVNFAFTTSTGGYFDIDPSDTLYVYDGPNTSSPLLATLNNTTAPFGATGSTTLSNTTGCITFQFVTDGATTAQGFQGEISCGYTCQPFQAWFATEPAIVPNDSSGVINICLGDTVVLHALADFPMSPSNGGNGYNQTLANSTIEWFIFGEPTQTGDSIMFIPDQRVGYFVDLTITDSLGCFDNARTRIQVSTIPSFSETHFLGSDIICLGETAQAVAGVTPADTVGITPTTGSFLQGGSFGEALELPDGVGSIDDIYTTTITINSFEPGDTVAAGSDIMDICISMEHSFLGDLEMWLTCPGAQDSVAIFNAYNGNSLAPGFIPGGFSPGGINLGIPGFGTAQGTCYEYCFSVTNNNFGTFASEYSGMTGQMTAGTYLPEETYNNLIGCPLNGDWKLSVADNWGQDDGWICEWGITFDPSIDPNAETYTPEVVTAWWSSDPTITSTQGDTLINAQPTVPGNYSYTFNMTDDFGCAYDTTIGLNVVPTLTSFTDAAVCATQYALSAAEYEIQGEWTYSGPQGGTATFTPNANAYSPNVSVDTFGDYEFIYTSDYCGQSDTLVIDFNPTPSPVALTNQTICPGTDLVFDAENEDIGATYLWMPGGATTQIFEMDSVLSSGGIQVTVTNDCGTANGAATITVHTLSVIGPLEVCLADEADLTATYTTTGGNWTYTGPTGATATFSPNEQDATPSVSVDMPGQYQFVFTDDVCAMQRTWDVAFTQAPTIEISLDTNRICVEDEITLSFQTNTNVYDVLQWDQYPSNATDTLVLLGTDSLTFSMFDTLFHVSATITNFCGTATDEVAYKVVDCALEVPNVFNPDSDVPDNAYFNLVSLGLHPGNNVKIFDRWGRKCYDVNDYHLNPWNGGNEKEGVYFWMLERPDYEAESGYVHLVRGSVN